jgi:CheY-like chemotaxis protein
MLGYAADSAHDGLDAIDRCRRRPPACVLMDVDMPVLGGIDAAMRLRDLQRSGDLPLFPVIAATADADAEAACRAAGMDAFLLKPLDLQLLRALLRRFTGDVTVR